MGIETGNRVADRRESVFRHGRGPGGVHLGKGEAGWGWVEGDMSKDMHCVNCSWAQAKGGRFCNHLSLRKWPQ